MANVYHATLSGDDLHEPKGIESAASGTVYVADGLGSGDWTASQQFGAAAVGSKTWTISGGPGAVVALDGLTNRFQKGIAVSGASGSYSVVTSGVYLAKANLDGVDWDPSDGPDGSVSVDVLVNGAVRRSFVLGLGIFHPQILEEFLELGAGDVVSWRLRKGSFGGLDVSVTSVFTSLVFIGAP